MNKSYDDVLEHVDINAFSAGMGGDGVESGLGVTQRSAGANMSVDVAAGTCRVGNTAYTESGITNVVITAAHATLNRRDLIVYDTSAGNPVVETGDAAAECYPPDIPAGDILLAVIYVDADVSLIGTADIKNSSIPLFSPIPQGMIMMWSSAEYGVIPSGYVICDGTNHTPDLRDRFIVGSGSTYTIDTTGGATTHNHGTVNTEYTGGNTVADNTTKTHLPPYYALAYIMKT